MHALLALLLLLSLGFLPMASSADFITGLWAYRSSDFDTAMQQWLPLIIKGDARAQFYYGEIYSGGTGVLQDDKQVVSWFRKSATQGHAQAQTRLGYMFSKGRGIKQSYQQSLYWYQKAANQGYVQAQYRIGFLYRDGLGTKPDLVAAYKWWHIATAWGDPDAPREKTRLKNKMSQQQVKYAVKLARLWSKRSNYSAKYH